MKKIPHDFQVFGDTDLQYDDGPRFRSGADSWKLRTDARHGSSVARKSIKEAVYTAIYLKLNAELQPKAAQFGSVTFLSAGEIKAINATGEQYGRARDHWRRRAQK